MDGHYLEGECARLVLAPSCNVMYCVMWCELE